MNAAKYHGLTLKLTLKIKISPPSVGSVNGIPPIFYKFFWFRKFRICSEFISWVGIFARGRTVHVWKDIENQKENSKI